MKLDPENTVAAIVSHVPLALDICVGYKDDMANLARERHDWTSVVAVLKRELSSLSLRGAGTSSGGAP